MAFDARATFSETKNGKPLLLYDVPDAAGGGVYAFYRKASCPQHSRFACVGCEKVASKENYRRKRGEQVNCLVYHGSDETVLAIFSTSNF